MLFEHAPRRVCLNEVSVRDGFQSEAVFVPTEDKIRLIDALSATGLARIEVTSFVSPKAIPNLRDAAEVMQAITRVPGVIYTALVPNEKGAERALACAADEINLVMSIGERHNLANMRMRCDQSLAQFRNIMQLVAAAPVRVNGTIATAFGCPFDGEQPLDEGWPGIVRNPRKAIGAIARQADRDRTRLSRQTTRSQCCTEQVGGRSSRCSRLLGRNYQGAPGAIGRATASSSGSCTAQGRSWHLA